MGAGASAGLADATSKASTDELKTAFKGMDEETQKKVRDAIMAMETPPAKKASQVARFNEIQPSPADPKGKFAVVGFKVPGATNGGSDKGSNGIRVDTIPIINSVIKAGGACEYIEYVPDQHDDFAAKVKELDAIFVRINPGQLSQGTPPGTQDKFDGLMNDLLGMGKLVWSSPAVQKQMGAKDALVQIKDMPIGLPDTFAYYDKETLIETFKKTIAFQPRVIKQNRGSAGEGIWLAWLKDKEYCSKFGEASADDEDKLKLMEMNDNHVEEKTVKEFMAFCVDGPGGDAGEWASTFPGKYLEGGKEAGGQLVDQRLLPRICEGEVRVLMVGDVCQMIIHKKPEGGLSAVGGNSKYTFYAPDCAEYKWLYESIKESLDKLMPALGLENEGLPILWTADYIPKDPEAGGEGTEYVVGEFNCSCVGISKFQAHCGGSLADCSDEDYADAVKLTDLMGSKAVEFVLKKKS